MMTTLRYYNVDDDSAADAVDKNNNSKNKIQKNLVPQTLKPGIRFGVPLVLMMMLL